jgi:zinc transport system ATP-binding protein
MLEIKNLYFSYNKSQPYLLDNINLKVEKGDYISILGENGSGKSTLVKLILKLLTPVKGEVVLSKGKVSYVAQRLEGFNSQFPLTVFELLNSTRKVLKIKDSSVIKNALEMVGMLDFQKALIGTLSGGQLQKVLIAKALIASPELLILDEPSTGIDVKSQEEIYTIIKALNRNNNLTVISIEHNINAALLYSSQIYYVHKGKGKLYSPDKYKELAMEGNSIA